MSLSWTTSLTPIREHYEGCFVAHGATAMGVDWRDRDAQAMRFAALANLLSEPCGVNDWGCGYGQFSSWIDIDSTYTGYDISKLMIEDARRELPGHEFIVSDHPTRVADYTVASGLFNVKGPGEWDQYVISCIWKMWEMSTKGFGFNMLHRRADRKREGLFYSNPEWVLDKLPSGLRVSVLQYYSPWDFTILAHKC